MTTCVYWIRSVDHTDMMSQGYIGVSGRFDRRMWEHYHQNGNRHLKHAIQKYGWDNLVKTQILIADEDYCLDIETKLRPKDKIGWNIVKGGGHPPSTPWNKGIPADPEHIKKMNVIRLSMPHHNLGKKYSEEVKKRMGAPKLGRPSKLRGIPRTAECVEKMTATVLSQKWICPHCHKEGVSVGAGNRWHFDNCKFQGNISWLV
jgi:predicted GIY-YIG superfamily endonuclease